MCDCTCTLKAGEYVWSAETVKAIDARIDAALMNVVNKAHDRARDDDGETK